MRGSRGGGEGGSTGVNGKGGSVNGGGSGSIPAAAKKVVQNLKEIVNCPELEIYAMLKECDMDPNEAVHRLLSQDPFHEVKSKREKKKEIKDATDPRSRGTNSTSSRGSKGGTERYGRAIMSQFATSDPAASRGNKSSYKKDNGAAAYTTLSASALGDVGNNVNRRPAVAREVPIESKSSAVKSSDVVSSAHITSFQSSWGPAPGQVSMADIVKRGRPQGKVPMAHQFTNMQQPSISSQPSPTPHEWVSAQNYSTKVSESVPETGLGGHRHLPPDDDWPIDHLPASSLPSISEPIVSESYTGPSGTVFDRANHQLQTQTDDIQYVEDGGVDSIQAGRNMHESSHGVFEEELFNDMNYPNHHHGLEQQEAQEVAVNMQQLQLSKDEEEDDEEEEEEDSPREANSPAVKIPDHLQVQTADCSHLSFGSFGSGMAVPFSGPFGSRAEKSDLEEPSAPLEEQTVGRSDTSNTEYYGDEHLRTVSDEHFGHRLAASSGGFDIPSASQSETLKQEASEVSPGNQYSFPSSANYGFENTQDLNASLSHSQPSSQMQNLSQLSGVMGYSSSLPSNLLVSSVQPPRENDLAYSPFPITQSAANKYSGNASPVGGSAISMAEALKAANFSTTQPSQNLPSGSNLSGGPALPQHLAMHPYSQPSLPFAAANMMGYPFLPPQSYTYMPQSAFQQAFAAGNSTYHQSLAAVLPQYKNSVSVSSLPQSAAAAALASGYGAFGSSNNVQGGNFPLNAPGSSNVAAAGPAPPATSMSYDDVLSSQYKEAAAHMLALQQQQNESSPLWVQGGPGSRTISAVPANAYYGFQGQTQHQQAPAGGGGYRQTQQPAPPQPHSQHFGGLGGYPNNFYQSNLPLEQHHHLQMAREGAQGGQPQQTQAKQPQHQQMWQNTY